MNLQQPSQVKQIQSVMMINKTTIANSPVNLLVYGTNIIPKNWLLFLLKL